jgi:cytochrome c-type biogenesis protein CcmE
MRRAHRVMAALAVVAAAGIIILWNTAAQETPTTIGVGEAKRQAAQLDDRPLQVRGFIQEGSIVFNGSVVESFVVADDHEALLVLYGQLPPDAFGPKDVVVNGKIRTTDDGSVVLDADSIHVGCSSKY